MMEEHLAYYLINEGYAVDESSAYKILDVISESFYEYLLSEAETDVERTSRRRREITRAFSNQDRRAQSARRREANRTVDPYGSETGAQQDRPSPRGGELPTRGQLSRTSAANVLLARAGQNPNRPHGKVTSSSGSPLISQSDFSPSTKTFVDLKPGRPERQVFNPNISSSIDVGPKVGGTRTTRLSRDESDDFSRGTSSPQQKKPQLQSSTQPTSTPAGRLPSQAQPQSQRATTPRRKPQTSTQTPAPPTTTPQRRDTSPPQRTNPTQSWRAERRPDPTTGTRGNPNRPNRMMGIIPKNS